MWWEFPAPDHRSQWWAGSNYQGRTASARHCITMHHISETGHCTTFDCATCNACNHTHSDMCVFQKQLAPNIPIQHVTIVTILTWHTIIYCIHLIEIIATLPKLLPKSTDSCIALRCNYALCAFLNCGHCYNHASAAFLSQQGPIFNGRGQLWLFCSWVGFKMQPSTDHRLQLQLKNGRQFFVMRLLLNQRRIWMPCPIKTLHYF